MHSTVVMNEKIFVQQFLEAFFRLRNDNVAKVKDYIKAVLYEVADEDLIKKESGTKPKKISSNFSLPFTPSLKKIKDYHKKKDEIRGLQADEEVAMVIISTNRIDKGKVETHGLRKQIADSLIGLPQSKSPDKLRDYVMHIKKLIVYDVSSGQFLYKYAKEDLIVLSSDEVKTGLVNNKLKLLSSGMQFLIRKFRSSSSSSAFKIIAPLYFNIFQTLFNGVKFGKIIFTTSNSFDIEMLRCYGLMSNHVKEVVEVMHGIPSTIVQSYFSDLVKLSEKMKFVTQIPSIQSLVLKERGSAVDQSIAINPYFMSYVQSQQSRFNNFNTYFEDKISAYIKLNKKLLEQKRIYLFIGGRDLEREFLNSDTFKVECGMIEQILKVDPAAMVLYSSHPFYNYESFQNVKLFSTEKVRCINDIVFCMLIADHAIGLLSSVIFESAYLGCQVFTPMMPEDRLFSKNILSLVEYPKIANNRLQFFNSFLKESVELKERNIFHRAKRRQELLGNWKRRT